MSNKIAFNKDYPVIDKSNKLYERANGLIPSFSQTLAKGPTQYVNGIAPKYLVKGKGSHVWDVDGNEYIDYNMGIGPLSLGYAYPLVDEAILKQLANGITFSLMHPLEVEVAEILREIIPNAESVRYSKSGADVTSAAIRIARAYTGKNKVLCCGYHGWHDWYVSTIARNAGIPQCIKDLTYTFAYNDIESFTRSIDDDVAAVIIEPVVFEAPKDDFLHKVAEICRKRGIILIFDEMWTGFRMALGGAQEYFGINADLATFSKAIANGMPVSVLTGKREIMQALEDEVFFFTTFGGEVLSLAAVKATIHEMKNKNVISAISTLGGILKEGYNKIAMELDLDYTRTIGYNFRTMVTFDEKAGNPLELKSFVQQELIKRGILWSGMHNMCYSHSIQDIEYTLSAYKAVLFLLKEAVSNNTVLQQIKGIPVQPTFRKTSGFNTKTKKSLMNMNDLFSLKGKIAIVTGALGLIGQKHCIALNEAGAHVVVADLDEQKCIEFAKTHLDYSMGHYLDVTKKESITELLKNVLINYRRVDVLVNNAAINDMFEDPKAAMEQSKFENYPVELWQKSLDVNLTGVFLCSQVIGTHMVHQKKGSIINISSTYGISAPDQNLYKDSEGVHSFFKPPAYPVTKAGVIMLSKYLASYWGQYGIRVNTLTPGGVKNSQSDFFIENYSRKTPLGRMAESGDYMGALVFLASDASAYMTGANLIVDGGWTCW